MNIEDLTATLLGRTLAEEVEILRPIIIDPPKGELHFIFGYCRSTKTIFQRVLEYLQKE